MRIILSSRRRHSVAIVSIFLIMLIMVALIAGMVGCGQAEPELECTPMVAAGEDHTVGLSSDGTVVAVGYNDEGQCNVGGWRDIVQVAAGGYHTVGPKSDGTVVAAGWEAELAKWNLGVTAEYALSISGTAGGSVTTPGEGVFVRNAGLLVLVVAKAERGYRFVNWSGDVDAIANVNATTTMISMRGDYSITANFEEKPPINWPPIGGIMGAVVVVGLVSLFVRRKRVGQAKEG